MRRYSGYLVVVRECFQGCGYDGKQKPEITVDSHRDEELAMTSIHRPSCPAVPGRVEAYELELELNNSLPAGPGVTAVSHCGTGTMTCHPDMQK
jgi:hypothetical protein